jgi:hypothetical protein
MRSVPQQVGGVRRRIDRSRRGSSYVAVVRYGLASGFPGPVQGIFFGEQPKSFLLAKERAFGIETCIEQSYVFVYIIMVPPWTYASLSILYNIRAHTNSEQNRGQQASESLTAIKY